MTDSRSGNDEDTDGDTSNPDVVHMLKKIYQLPGGDKDPFKDTVESTAFEKERIMTDNVKELDSSAMGGKPLKSLFNALSMAKKYGRDALICAGVYTGISLASGGGSDMLGIDPIINLTAISLLTAVFTSIGRYVGGAMGYGLDRAYDSHKKNPALTTSFGRKALAGVGGVAAGAAFATALTLSLMVMGMKSAENNSVDPAGKQILVSNPVAQTRTPLARI